MIIQRFGKLLLTALVVLSISSSSSIRPVSAKIAWVDDWLEYVVGDGMDATETVTLNTLSLYEVGEMRVRDIKRRLQRTHGYGADELGRMLDKKELINALAFEEHKTRERRLDKQKRHLLHRGIIGALIAVAVVLCWPLLSHAWEVGMVNFVVFSDRKRFEAGRCYELQSMPGFIGILCMAIIDILKFWLSISVLGSWVTTSKYFFPIPSLSIRPAQFMGSQVAGGPMAKYGFNVGPMVIRWIFGFLSGQFEKWTGKMLAKAQRDLKVKNKVNREHETPLEQEERKARKAARKVARQSARDEADAAAAASAARRAEPPPPPGDVPEMDAPVFPVVEKEKQAYETASVEQFLGQEYNASQQAGADGVDNPTEPESSGFDELD